MYAAYTIVDEANDMGGVSIQQSTDGGYTWTILEEYRVSGTRFPSVDLIVTGMDAFSLKLTVVGIRYTVATANYALYVDRYNAFSGLNIGSNYNLQKGTDRINDVEIASDYEAPAVGASPYSVSFVYSTFGPVYDSIVAITSLDGGDNFTVRQTVATTPLILSYLHVAQFNPDRWGVDHPGETRFDHPFLDEQMPQSAHRNAAWLYGQ